MKLNQQAFISLLLGLLPATLGQVSANAPGPSPTQSVNCEAHGDHWHCDGPRVTSTTGSPSTLTSVFPTVPTAHHEDDDDDDHHDHDTDDHDHNHDDDQVSLNPSPTKSVGCKAHGDHWHCDGPASTAPGQSTLATSATSSATGVPSGVSTVGTSGAAGSRGITWLSILFGTVVGIAMTV